VELRQVVLGRVEAEALEVERPLATMEGQHAQRHAVRACKLEGDRLRALCLELHGLTVDDPLRGRRRIQVGIKGDVVPPEQDVVGGERLSVRPLEPLPQVQR
jgi:hypothetical protein